MLPSRENRSLLLGVEEAVQRNPCWPLREKIASPVVGVCVRGTHVGAAVVVDGSLGQHGVVLQLRLAKRRGVASNQNQLGLARSQGCQDIVVSMQPQSFSIDLKRTLESGLVTQNDLTRLHHQGKARVQGVTGLGLLLGGGHLD